MENQKIKYLQNELLTLTNRFNENMKRISSLLTYSKQKNQSSVGVQELENADKAISERLKLIEENFKINWQRVDILRKLKKIQNRIHPEDSFDIPAEKKSICTQEFFDNWKQEYESKGDFLMVEIIDILNN